MELLLTGSGCNLRVQQCVCVSGEYPSTPPPPPPAVSQVVDSLDVSTHGTRVGLAQYSSRVRTEFPLNMNHSADEIKAAVMKVNLFVIFS